MSAMPDLTSDECGSAVEHPDRLLNLELNVWCELVVGLESPVDFIVNRKIEADGR